MPKPETPNLLQVEYLVGFRPHLLKVTEVELGVQRLSFVDAVLPRHPLCWV